MPDRPASNVPSARDAVYAEQRERIDAFRFDAAVADVFADMIARSVPGYALTLQMIAVVASRFARSGTHCYDLGCSLGASTLAIRHHVPHDCVVIGVDNSPPMVERARAIAAADRAAAAIEIRCEDVCAVALRNASLVTLNFTLQFVPPPPMAANLSAFVTTLSRGLSRRSQTLCSKGMTSAVGFIRRIAAATSAAPSIQRIFDVAPLRTPVIGEPIEPDTSTST